MNEAELGLPLGEGGPSSPTLPSEAEGLGAEPKSAVLLLGGEKVALAAEALDNILSGHRPGLPDAASPAVDVERPDRSKPWVRLFGQNARGPRAFRALVNHAVHYGWVDENELHALASLARSAKPKADIIRWLRVVLGDLGAIVVDGGAPSASSAGEWATDSETGSLAEDEAEDALGFLGRLSDESLGALALLEKEARRAPVLSGVEEKRLFGRLAAARQQLLEDVAAHRAARDLLIEWAGHIEAGRLSPSDITTDEHLSSPQGVGPAPDDEGASERDPASSRALASLLRQTASLYDSSAPTVRSPSPFGVALSGLSLTYRRIIELAEHAIIADVGTLRSRPRACTEQRTSQANSDLRRLRRPRVTEPSDQGPEGGGVALAARLEAALDQYRAVRDRIARSNLRLVLCLALRYAAGPVPLLDLVQEGQIGLLRAIERHDASQSGRFGTYAKWWIRYGVRRAIQDQGRTIRLPVYMVERLGRVRRTAERLRLQNGSDPDHQQIAAAMAETPEAVCKTMAVAVEFVPLDELWEPDGDEQDDAPSGVAEVVADAELSSPLTAFLHSDLQRRLQQALRRLRSREGQILCLRFGIDDGHPRTREEIGQCWGLTRERIRQIEGPALVRLLRWLPSRHFENLAP